MPAMVLSGWRLKIYDDGGRWWRRMKCREIESLVIMLIFKQNQQLLGFLTMFWSEFFVRNFFTV